MPRKPSSNVAMNSAPCRCAAATIAASAKLTSGAANAELTQRGRKEIATGQKVQLLLIQQDIRYVERRAKARALRTLWDEAAIGIASHQVDVFIFEPSTDRYVVRLYNFNACPKGKAECAGSPAAGMWRCCVSTRGSGVERRAWPRAVRSGCSNARRGCGAARAICRFSMSRRWVTECRMEWEFGKRVIEAVKWLTQPFWETSRTCSTCMREVAACMTLFDTR